MNESADTPSKPETPASPTPWLERRGPSLLALAVVVLVGAALRFYRIGVLPLWRDEGATLRFARRTFGELWGPLAVLETNPPLYYSVQRVWLVFGESESAIRSLSAVLGVISIGLTYLLAAGLSAPAVRRRTGLIAAALYAVAAMQIEYAQEARAYGMMTTFALGAMVCLSAMLRHPEAASRLWWKRDGSASLSEDEKSPRLIWAWAGYIFSSLVMLYTHNTAVVPMACIQLLTFIWWLTAGRRSWGFFGNWVAANVLVLVGWGWWIPRIMGQANGRLQANWWIPQANWGSVREAFEMIYLYIHLNRIGFVAMLLGIAVMLLGLLAWRKRPVALLMCLGMGVGGIAVLYGLNLWRPIFLSRALVWTAPAMFALMAAGMMMIRPTFLRLGVIGVLVLLSTKNVHSSYALIKKSPWDQAATYVRDRDEADHLLVFIWEDHDTAFDYYYPQDTSPADRIGLVDLPADEFDAEAPTAYFITLDRVARDQLATAAQGYHTVWLITSSRPEEWESSAAVLGEVESEEIFGPIQVREYR
ncbi:MAG: glycosyltransferase family 39 protein [Planctomycetota bacterium]